MSNFHVLGKITSRLCFTVLIALPIWPGGGNGLAHAEPVLSPTEQYRSYLVEQISQTLANAKRLRERAAANDVDGAKQAWIAARVGWEQAEVFISGFVSDLDEDIDAWPNALSGFHAIEARLFGANTADVAAAADQLIYHLTDLDIKIRQIPLNSQGLLNGAARLAYEVGADAKSLEPGKVRTASEELIVALQAAAPKIGLQKPTLEDITQ